MLLTIISTCLLVGVLLLVIFRQQIVNRLYAFKQTRAKTNPQLQHGIAFQDVHFPTVNNKTLHAWFIANESTETNPTVILTHGWSQNAEYLLPVVPIFYKHGFNVLMIESRSHGQSDHDGLSHTGTFSEDIQSAIRYLVQDRDDVDSNKIGLFGFSMGAAGTYHAASQSEHVKFIVTMGCYANHQRLLRRDWIKYGVSGRLLQMIMDLTRNNFPNDEEIQPNKMISRIGEDIPILIIHGTLDGGAPFEDAIELRDLVKARVSKFVAIEGAKHLNLFRYEQTLKEIDQFVKCIR